MVRLPSLPDLEIIKGFRGHVDFAVWKGIPYARKWPRTPRSHLTPATLAAAQVFGAILKAYALLAGLAKDLYAQDAADQTRTGRDIYVSAVLGHLHEATMSDFLDLLTECRDSLALIDDLVGALRSVDTDKLIVRAEDQLFSYKDRYFEHVESLLVAAGNHTLTASSPPAGEIWAITNAYAYNDVSAITWIENWLHDGAAAYRLSNILSPAIREPAHWTGLALIKPGDSIRARFTGCVLNDNIYLNIAGYKMTKEA